MTMINMALLLGCIMTIACAKEKGMDSTITTGGGAVQTNETGRDFIETAEWLTETQWTVQRQYNEWIGEETSWIQFIRAYTENGLGNPISDGCRDTIYFGDGTYILFGPRGTISGEYRIEDSLVYISDMPLYQVSIDSMIVCGWHDCTYTADMQQWLFTMIH